MSSSYAGKIPLKAIILYKSFPYLEKLSPKLATTLAFKVFLKPFRFKIPEDELVWRKKASKEFVSIEGKQCALWHWESKDPNGETILLMHGWASRATHFHHFIETLLKQGYNVVGADAPGHGASSGSETNYIEFSECIRVMQEKYHCKKWITHSMGGAAALWVIKNGVKPKHLSIVTTPSLAEGILQNFSLNINASKKMPERLAQKFIEDYEEPFEHFTASYFAKKIEEFPAKTLLIYDEKDRDAPIKDGKALHAQIPRSELVITKEFGHTKIIKSKEVLDRIIQDWT